MPSALRSAHQASRESRQGLRDPNAIPHGAATKLPVWPARNVARGVTKDEQRLPSVAVPRPGIGDFDKGQKEPLSSRNSSRSANSTCRLGAWPSARGAATSLHARRPYSLPRPCSWPEWYVGAQLTSKGISVYSGDISLPQLGLPPAGSSAQPSSAHSLSALNRTASMPRHQVSHMSETALWRALPKRPQEGGSLLLSSRMPSS